MRRGKARRYQLGVDPAFDRAYVATVDDLGMRFAELPSAPAVCVADQIDARTLGRRR